MGPMPTWVVRMVAGVVPGEWPGTGRGLAPVRCPRGCRIRGFWAGAGPLIQHHYEVLAIWLRTRSS